MSETALPVPGVVDMHFDLLMDLYEKRRQPLGILDRDFGEDMRRGGIGVVGAAIYLLDSYLPDQALRVSLDMVSRLLAELDVTDHFALCRSYTDIVRARAAGQVALILTMEGVEPLGNDLALLRVFYELGLRQLGLTHARRNYACDGAVFAPSGSSKQGLTPFGRVVVQECERLGIVIDLAHINPAGFEDVLALTTRPVIISHTNARRYYDIERNSSDEQVRAVAVRGGVVGVNATLVSREPDGATLDRFVDHIAHFVDLVGVDGVGIGFDFFKSVQEALPPAEKAHIAASLSDVSVIPDLSFHADAPNVTVKLRERGFADADVAKIMYGNWLRLFETLL